MDIYRDYPIKPQEFVGAIGDTFIMEYENICARVGASILNDNKQLEDNIIKIIKKHSTPIERLNKEIL